MGISPVRSQNRIDRIGLVLFLLLSGNDFRYSRVQKRNRPVVKLNRVLVKRRWLYRTKEGLIDTLLYGRQFQVHVPTSKYWYFDSTHTHSEETKEHKPLQHITHHHHNNRQQPPTNHGFETTPSASSHCSNLIYHNLQIGLP